MIKIQVSFFFIFNNYVHFLVISLLLNLLYERNIIEIIRMIQKMER